MNKCNCENTHCSHNDSRPGKFKDCTNNADYDGGEIAFIGHVCGQCYVEYPEHYKVLDDAEDPEGLFADVDG